jgi:hypothetical protein
MLNDSFTIMVKSTLKMMRIAACRNYVPLSAGQLNMARFVPYRPLPIFYAVLFRVLTCNVVLAGATYSGPATYPDQASTCQTGATQGCAGCHHSVENQHYRQA